jgi:hypothetical protein
MPFRSCLVAALGLGAPALSLRGQTRALDFTYGAWQPDTLAIVWSLGYAAPLPGPFDYGVALTHVEDSWSPFNRTLTGGEVSLGLGRDGSGVYAVASAGLGLRHGDGSLDVLWSAGAGAAVRPLPFLSLGIEGRMRAEDQGGRGFWRLDPADRTGFTLLGRVALLWPARRLPPQPGFDPPSAGETERAARNRGVSRDGSSLAANVVATAVGAMGSPYQWGGDGANGFDCSGLIQYAYGQHGIILPRIGREQARLGVRVEPRAVDLNPGDILGFSVEGAGVTHVGLYVGDGQFIHSSSSGVKLSSLTATDPDSQWWQRRLVAARRIIR